MRVTAGLALLLAFDGEILLHAVHLHHHGRHGDLARDVHPRSGAAGKYLRPALAHLVLSAQARPGRMDADDFLVFRPDRHHGVEVGALERLVEGVLRVLRGGEDLLAHRSRLWISSATISTVISRMQRKWPSGHT